HAAAVDEAEQVVVEAGRAPFLLSALGCAYAKAGRRPDAERVVDELLRRRHTEYVAPLTVAEVYAALGERTLACEWLERAVDDRNGLVASLPVSPQFDLLRDDPRFEALVGRLLTSTATSASSPRDT